MSNNIDTELLINEIQKKEVLYLWNAPTIISFVRVSNINRPHASIFPVFPLLSDAREVTLV